MVVYVLHVKREAATPRDCFWTRKNNCTFITHLISSAMEADTIEIDAQIAALQAERAKKLAKIERSRLAKETEEAKIIVGCTPIKPRNGMLSIYSYTPSIS